MDFLTDVLTALAVVINGIPQGLLALSFGFAAFPTALAFIVGGLGSWFFMSPATVSFQAETITLSGTMGSNIKERLSLVFWGGVLSLVPALFGANEAIVSFIGPIVVTSMMAGIGIMLANISVDLFKSDKITGSISMITALITWFIFKDLAKTIIVSVAISTLVYVCLKYIPGVKEKLNLKFDDVQIDKGREKFTVGNIEWKFWTNKNIILGALSVACLNIGANISFGKITGGIANMNTNVDHLAIYSAFADMVSSFFGGAGVEAIISGTAAAPHPIFASVLMMGLMALILFARLLPTIGKFVHKSAIAGFLFVLGVFVTFATNIQGALSLGGTFAGPYGFGTSGMIIGATTLVTARFNPFYGLLAGLLVKVIFLGF